MLSRKSVTSKTTTTTTTTTTTPTPPDWRRLGELHPAYTLPADFSSGGWGGRRAVELAMMAQLLWLEREGIRRAKDCADMTAELQEFEKGYREARTPQDLLPLASVIKSLLSQYNLCSRNAIRDRKGWPRRGLARFVVSDPIQMPAPQTPCDYIDEEFGWWGFGQFAKGAEWVGHGLWWKPMPGDAKKGSLENAAGNAANDHDVLEDGFVRLKKARVVCADYSLLREDFPELYAKGDADIDQWLLDNCAYISGGQVERLGPGGDQGKLMGIESAKDLDDYIERAQRKPGIRLRSGGRACTFLVGDQYKFVRGRLVARMLDVKGVGTHAMADVSHPKVTGMLNFADAVREMMFQRLIQRLIDLENMQHVVNTVKFYGIIDTGLKYKGKNPATGWDNEPCVLSLRQRHSRMLDTYEGFNFSGICPSHTLKEGPGRALRRLLIKYGVSAEFFPRALLYNTPDSDGISLPENATGGLLDDIEGTWNLQADAMGKNFMDFTDFYVLPRSPLGEAWAMTEKALADAMCLERKNFVDIALSAPSLRKRVFGGASTKEEAEKWYKERLKKLSDNATYIEAAHSLDEDDKYILPNKPKYCMCWFMELDDSGMSKWAMAVSKDVTDRKQTASILKKIDSALPVSPLPEPPLAESPSRGYEELPSRLGSAKPPETDPTPPESVYHSGWKPGKAQAPPHGDKCVSLSPEALGRGLYKLVISCIVPRPIALVSSVSKDGLRNLAPFSYFGAMNHNPPTVCFSPVWNRGGNARDGYDKDTLRNIKETKEFVLHIMSKWFIDVANHSCGGFAYGEDEFKIAGATPVPSVLVKPPRVKEAAIQLECKLEALHEIKDEEGVVKATMVIGRIVLFHIHEGVFDAKTQTVDAAKLQPISRLGGNTYGQTAGMFDLPRPVVEKKSN